jgi:GT2 family glycosyltransferase
MSNCISFIIVNYFTNKLANNLIHSILQHNSDTNSEIIVVDNTTNEQYRFKSTIADVKIHYSNKNMGFGSACNMGAKLALSDNLVFINPDTLFFNNNSIRVILESFNRFSKDTIFGGRILNKNNKPVCSTFKFSNFIHIYFQNSFRRVIGISLPLLTNKDNTYKEDQCSEVDWISGAFLCINKIFFWELGGFDEEIFMYEEDAELCYRAKQVNGKVIFTPMAEVVHYGGAASKDNNELLSYIGLKSTLYFYQKRHNYLQTMLLKKLILMTWHVIYLQFMIFTIVSPSLFKTKKLFWKKLITFSKQDAKNSKIDITHHL